MSRRLRYLFLLSAFLGCALLVGIPPVSAQSETCSEMKKDIDGMKADLKDYEKGYEGSDKLEADDKSDLMQTITDIREDFREYLTDSSSDQRELGHARRGMRLAAEMEDGVKNEDPKKAFSNYGEIIQVYDWFSDDEDCDQPVALGR